jgi:hypothetical protein
MPRCHFAACEGLDLLPGVATGARPRGAAYCCAGGGPSMFLILGGFEK